MVDKQIKKKIREHVESHGPTFKRIALAGFADEGRGHLMYFVKPPKQFQAHFKRGSGAYISQAQEAKNVKLQPQSKDEELEKMVREYDPETEAVLIAFWGTQYLKCRLRFDRPLTDEEWSQVTILGGTH